MTRSPFWRSGQGRTKYNRLLDDHLKDDQIRNGSKERATLLQHKGDSTSDNRPHLTEQAKIDRMIGRTIGRFLLAPSERKMKIDNYYIYVQIGYQMDSVDIKKAIAIKCWHFLLNSCLLSIIDNVTLSFNQAI